MTVDQREQEIKQLQGELSQAEADYNSLKMAKMLEVTDGDMELHKSVLPNLSEM